jgi:hypothetical protein
MPLGPAKVNIAQVSTIGTRGGPEHSVLNARSGSDIPRRDVSKRRSQQQ